MGYLGVSSCRCHSARPQASLGKSLSLSNTVEDSKEEPPWSTLNPSLGFRVFTSSPGTLIIPRQATSLLSPAHTSRQPVRLGFAVSGLGLGVLAFGFGVLGFGFGVWGFGFHV